ncbi:MAG: DinB family protein [Oscillochloris sp.]|nr:DinB family protein [Oscillochloris sp.]
MGAAKQPPAIPPEPIELIETDVASEAFGPEQVLEDRIGAFSPSILATDALELREILQGFFERIKPDAWLRRTERRPGGWTLHETVAHIEAVTGGYLYAVEAGLAGRSPEIPGLSQRRDLANWNRAQIAARAEQEPQALCAAILEQLSLLARIAGSLTPDPLTRSVPTPMYGGDATIGELLGGALTHIGIVHGAQLAQGARSQPIWIWYRAGMMRRQLTRFFHLMGLAYWPERGGSLHATIAFSASGSGGGSWYVRVAPSGGYGRIGRVRTADLTLEFASVDLLCRAITLHVRPLRYLLLRQIKLRGNLRLATRFGRYFIPT